MIKIYNIYNQDLWIKQHVLKLERVQTLENVLYLNQSHIQKRGKFVYVHVQKKRKTYVRCSKWLCVGVRVNKPRTPRKIWLEEVASIQL